MNFHFAFALSAPNAMSEAEYSPSRNQKFRNDNDRDDSQQPYFCILLFI